MPSRKSHLKLVREALERGEKLTWLDSFRRWNHHRLSARIFELRGEGMIIYERKIKTESGKHVSQYSALPFGTIVIEGAQSMTQEPQSIPLIHDYPKLLEIGRKYWLGSETFKEIEHELRPRVPHSTIHHTCEKLGLPLRPRGQLAFPSRALYKRWEAIVLAAEAREKSLIPVGVELKGG